MANSDHKPDNPPSAENLAALVRVASKKGPPPVHMWNPPFCGDLDIRILRDGTWLYLGTPIGRPALVRLFASILKREGDAYFLVSPVEKVGIIVEDAPFIAVDFDATGTGNAQKLIFETNVGDSVTAGPRNPLRLAINPATGAPAPYVHVRRNLEARIDRKSFYRLVDIAEEDTAGGGMRFGVWSDGAFFPFMEADALARSMATP